MVRLEQWLSHTLADELVTDLEKRKDLLLKSLEGAQSDSEVLRLSHQFQATSQTISYLKQKVAKAREATKHEG